MTNLANQGVQEVTVKTQRRYRPSWFIRKDLPEIMRIETQCFNDHWSEADFIKCMRTKNCICCAARVIDDESESIAGYMIYELHEDRYEIINIAVSKEHQRNGVGTTLINTLKNRLNVTPRNRLLAAVCESNLNAQLFFKQNDFLCTRIIKGIYETIEDDCYLMQYKYNEVEG